jgi:NitT/TauT family transport system substrate-binding protein
MPPLDRRTILQGATALASAAILGAAADLPELRLGVLQFGTVQWVADIVRRHALDAKHGLTLRNVPLANTDAGRISLMAGGSDVVVSDWPFVAVQRAGGTKLCFSPFSSSNGGIIVPANSQISDFAGLSGKKLGVVGGPVDKSWLVVQAAARAKGVDLANVAQVVYGAPPLLGAKLQQGELDAVLTFWNFAAKLEAAGFRQAVSVADCAAALGLPAHMSLVGFVFHEDWARANRPAIDGFLAAVAEAESLLGQNAEWQAVRPLMDAPDEAVFQRLKARFLEGAAPAGTAAAQLAAAERLFAVLLATGGKKATGGIDALPPGIFWPQANEAS